MIGEEGIAKLQKAHVAVFGLGGVGGYCLEALARAGVGHLTLVDFDTVDETNLNRQILALKSTVGRKKAEVARERVLDINPDAEVEMRDEFFLPENAATFDFSKFDYVADCIDTVTGKIALIEACKKAGTRIISSMGTGNKTDASAFRVADIEKTKVCPLARVMRRELKARNISDVPVVYSEEQPFEGKQRTPFSMPHVPGAAGLLMAGKIISDLTEA